MVDEIEDEITCHKTVLGFVKKRCIELFSMVNYNLQTMCSTNTNVIQVTSVVFKEIKIFGRANYV